MTSTLTAPVVLDPQVQHPAWCNPALHESGDLDHRHISRPVEIMLDNDLPDDRAVITASIEQYVGGGVGNWTENAPVIRLLVNSGSTTHSNGVGDLDLTASDTLRLCRVLAELQAAIDAV